MGCCCSTKVIKSIPTNENTELFLYEEREYFPYCFIHIKEIERGASSEVWKAKDIYNNKLICKKVKRKYLRKANREINILKELSGDCFPKYIYSYSDMNYMNIYMKDVLGIDIFNYVTTKGVTNREKEIIIKKMLICINELHKIGYVHLDIKLENFIIYRGFKIILIDFGCSHLISEKEKSLKIEAGTIGYNSPEIYKGLYHKTSDFWNWGICVWVLYINDTPFDFIEPMEDIKNNFKFPDKKHEKELEKMSEEQRELFKNIFKPFNERYGFNDIIKNVWIKSI